ncbi:MAG: hypothetical protein LC748_05605 [Thermomicrobia bacterium]|nr:hypothetical protein [Thermomicrobia bacterium]
MRCAIFCPPLAARRLCAALLGILLLVGCGGGSSPTAVPTVRPTTTPPPTIDPSLVHTGSAIVPSPIGQTANSALTPPPDPTSVTVPVPTITTGTVLQPLSGGQTFTTADKKVAIHYPQDWDAQTTATAAQFTPKGASPTDPNVPRVAFNSLPAQLNLLTGDNAANYLQSLVTQTTARGATNLTVRSLDRVRLGSASGLEAIRLVVAYTQGVPVVSEQVIVQPAGSATTWVVSATAPAADFAAKWGPIIDGIAGSIVFT